MPVLSGRADKQVHVMSNLKSSMRIHVHRMGWLHMGMSKHSRMRLYLDKKNSSKTRLCVGGRSLFQLGHEADIHAHSGHFHFGPERDIRFDDIRPNMHYPPSRRATLRVKPMRRLSSEFLTRAPSGCSAQTGAVWALSCFRSR